MKICEIIKSYPMFEKWLKKSKSNNSLNLRVHNYRITIDLYNGWVRLGIYDVTMSLKYAWRTYIPTLTHSYIDIISK